VALSLLLLAIFASSAQAEVITKKRQSGAAGKRAIEAYWTAERLEAARPIEALRTADGEPVVRPDKDALNHPTPFETGPVADPTWPPNTVNGKVFGKIRGVGGYECSATSVDALGRNVIVTAGHCVAEPGLDIAKKIVFIPSFENGVRPYGTWVYEKIHVLKSWRKRQNFNFDFSAVRMSPQNGINLQDAVGGSTPTINLPVDQTYTSVGYPSNIEDGQVMWNCIGPFAGRDPRPIPKGPLPIAMGCDMGPGASGGGWFVNGSLVSVTSFGYEDHPDVGYGPFFGAKARKLFIDAGVNIP